VVPNRLPGVVVAVRAAGVVTPD